MQPLNDDEAALLHTVQMYGSLAWPIRKMGRSWWIDSWRSWRGFPTPFKTKREAEARFQTWIDSALERWRAMKMQNPNLILTAVGVR